MQLSDTWGSKLYTEFVVQLRNCVKKKLETKMVEEGELPGDLRLVLIEFENRSNVEESMYNDESNCLPDETVKSPGSYFSFPMCNK